LVAEARSAIQEEAGLDRVRPLAADLQQVVHSLPASASAPSGDGGSAPSGNGATDAEAEEEDVVDAEFTRD
jgi:molecular chaperone DnaK